MPKIDTSSVPSPKGSGYPSPFDEPCAARPRRCLGDAGGLRDFGVNLVTLPPGSWSSQRHRHSHEDEFVYLLEGELVGGNQPKSERGLEGSPVTRLWLRAAGAERQCEPPRRLAGASGRPLNLTVMRHSVAALILALSAGVCHGQTTSAEITKEEATRIALAAAGCKNPTNCIARGYFKNHQWIFSITFVDSWDASGKPLIRPGGWTGITLDSKGHVIDKMLGE